MAGLELEGEIIMTSAEPVAEGSPEPEDFAITTIVAVVTTMMSNSKPAAKPKKKVPFFEDAALHWPTALEAWGTAWPLHVYLAALAYVVLAFMAIFYAVRVLVERKLPGRAYYLAINLAVFACCPGRAVFLLVDPYRHAKVLNWWQYHLTRTFLWPSITSAFILVFALVLRVIKMQVVSPHMFSHKMVIFIILSSYVIALTADFLGAAFANLVVLLLCCEAYFTLLGIVASSSYFYVFCRMYIGTVINRQKLNQIAEPGAKTVPGGSEKSILGKKEQELTTKLPVAAKITLVAAGSFLAIAIINIWQITSALLYFQNRWKYNDHWQWFFRKTLLRLAEVMMCGSILSVASLPFSSKNLD